MMAKLPGHPRRRRTGHHVPHLPWIEQVSRRATEVDQEAMPKLDNEALRVSGVTVRVGGTGGCKPHSPWYGRFAVSLDALLVDAVTNEGQMGVLVIVSRQRRTSSVGHL